MRQQARIELKTLRSPRQARIRPQMWLDLLQHLAERVARHRNEGIASPGNSQVITVGGLSYTVTYTTSSANFTQTPNATSQPVSGINCEATLTVPTNGIIPGTPGDSGTSTVIDSITLPDGKQYKFKYESHFGLLSEIDYPDGGWARYTWKFSDALSDYLQYTGTGADNVPSGLCNMHPPSSGPLPRKT